MNGSWHLLIGTATAFGLTLSVTSFTGVEMESTQVLLAVAAAGIGSLAPDIDHPRSTISFGIPRKLVGYALPRLLGVALIAGLLAYGSKRDLINILWGWYTSPIAKSLVDFLVVIGLVGIGLFFASQLISAIFGHRGATHSLAFLVVATLVAVGLCYMLGFPLIYGVIFGWGYLSHLLADSLTPMGLPDLLWPMTRGA